MIGNDTHAWRRRLPHLQRTGKTYFVTFRTHRFRALLPVARDIALGCCVHDHLVTYWLHAAVIMPDHVHMLITPYEEWGLPAIMSRVKGVSAHLINVALGQRGTVWQREAFDHIIRSNEDCRKKADYLVMNPVRKGLADGPDEYSWIYRSWIEGAASCAPDIGGARR